MGFVQQAGFGFISAPQLIARLKLGASFAVEQNHSAL
jgi:hypothetical protein